MVGGNCLRLCLAAVPMSNWLGGMALAMGLAAYFFAGLPGGQKTLPVLLRTAALGLWAYAMAMPWPPPSTIAVIRANAPRVANNFRAGDTRQHLFVASVAGGISAQSPGPCSGGNSRATRASRFCFR